MNLDKMNLKELLALNERIKAQLPETANRERAAVRGEIDKLLEAKGLKLTDVLGPAGSARRSTKGRAVPIKFRDPKNPENAWSGRGRTPKWFDRKHPERFQVAESA